MGLVPTRGARSLPPGILLAARGNLNTEDTGEHRGNGDIASLRSHAFLPSKFISQIDHLSDVVLHVRGADEDNVEA